LGQFSCKKFPFALHLSGDHDIFAVKETPRAAGEIQESRHVGRKNIDR
jgi:hypothetical protein